MTEFELIQKYFSGLGGQHEGVVVGIGDDAAIIDPPPESRLCISIDTLVSGVHFPVDTAPQHIATRALASALSDLAAMGASASHFTLAITMPSPDAEWLKAFSGSLAAMARKFDLALVGGDTTRGPLAVSVQVHGWLPRANALLRSSCQPGELLLVSGTLGDAGGALQGLLSSDHKLDSGAAHHAYLRERFYRPTPRLALGEYLLGQASACIDISDGLVQDAGHLSVASGCCLEIDAAALPLSEALRGEYPAQCTELALTAGDDYELLFSLPSDRLGKVRKDCPVPITVIGRVLGQGIGVRVKGFDMQGKQSGYRHFE